MGLGTAVMDGNKRLTVLVIASGGGHWLQLCRLAPAWQGCRVVSACTADAPEMPGRVVGHRRLRDATRWDRWGVAVLGLQVARLMVQWRPDVVVTTGALPGLWAVFWGRCLGARTVWIDSLANVQQLSGSGRLAGFIAHEWWTQWPHLGASPPGVQGDAPPFKRKPRYHGAVW